MGVRVDLRESGVRTGASGVLVAASLDGVLARLGFILGWGWSLLVLYLILILI